jgi:hypothetical protein
MVDETEMIQLGFLSGISDGFGQVIGLRREILKLKP